MENIGGVVLLHETLVDKTFARSMLLVMTWTLSVYKKPQEEERDGIAKIRTSSTGFYIVPQANGELWGLELQATSWIAL